MDFPPFRAPQAHDSHPTRCILVADESVLMTPGMHCRDVAPALCLGN